MMTGTRRMTLIALAGLALAMSDAPRPAMAASPAPAMFDPPEEQRLLDIDFSGGTLGNYFDLVADSADSNIVARADVRNLEMPPIRLRSVTTTTAVELVSSLFDNPTTGRVVLNYVNSGEPISTYVATLERDGPPPEPATINEVFSIGDVLRPASEEAIEGQVRRIFEMIDSAMQITFSNGARPEQPELAFHEDTQMLLFRGAPEQRRMIEAVLERYNNSWRPQQAKAEDLREAIIDAEYQLGRLQVELDAAARRFDLAQMMFDRAEAAHAAGGASDIEVGEARLRATQAQEQVELTTMQIQQVEKSLENWRTNLATLMPDVASTIVVYDFRDLGTDGERIGTAFKALLQASELPETSIEPNGEGLVTLRAAAPLHEALRYLLNQARQVNQPSQPGGR